VETRLSRGFSATSRQLWQNPFRQSLDVELLVSNNYLIFLSVPGLRPRDIDPALTPTLYDWANRGVLAELTPTFPCVTSCVQASMWTGLPPGQHGVIANGFYHRDRREVEFWVGRNGGIEGEQIWDAIKRRNPALTSAVWHAQNIKDAAADFLVTPAPIHEPDGSMKLWCYSKPEPLYQQILDDGLGHFPLQHYWGPLANIESTRWILRAALWLIRKHAPNFHWIYIPHLDYAAQKSGPNSQQARDALTELDSELAAFAAAVNETAISNDVIYLVAGEYALTDVRGVIYPNRILREAGFLALSNDNGHELLDLPNSPAFAVVDHQLAHVYVAPGVPVARTSKADVISAGPVGLRSPNSPIADLFRNTPGIARVCAGDDRRAIGMDHPRCGDIILVAAEDHWFAYYWWLDDALAPPFARTVDIHRKPGYDPVELFFDPKTKSIPLDAALVRGSHGVPAFAPHHRTALISSSSTPFINSAHPYRDTDVKAMTLQLLGLPH